MNDSSLHLESIYANGELQEAATVKDFLIVRNKADQAGSDFDKAIKQLPPPKPKKKGGKK